MNQIGGNLAETRLQFTGTQSPIQPDSNHIITADGSGNDINLVAANVFVLTLLDKAKERAKTLTPAIRPIKIGGKSFYVGFIHPYQTTDMRINTSTGQWLDIQKAAMTGGEIDDNPIFDGSYDKPTIANDNQQVAVRLAA